MRILVAENQTKERPVFSEVLKTLLKLLFVNDDISLQQEASLCLKEVIAK